MRGYIYVTRRETVLYVEALEYWWNEREDDEKESNRNEGKRFLASSISRN